MLLDKLGFHQRKTIFYPPIRSLARGHRASQVPEPSDLRDAVRDLYFLSPCSIVG